MMETFCWQGWGCSGIADPRKVTRVGVDRVLAQLAEQLLLTPEVPGLKIQSSAEYVISVRMPATEKIFRTKRKESNLDWLTCGDPYTVFLLIWVLKNVMSRELQSNKNNYFRGHCDRLSASIEQLKEPRQFYKTLANQSARFYCT